MEDAENKNSSESGIDAENQAVVLAGVAQPFVIGSVQTKIGSVPQVSSTLTGADKWGAVKVRSRIGRMDYSIDPGLYALADPDENSPVLVTANYKLTFDSLREKVPGLSAWILVLDTKGINVWCAAGKGTFGTDELVSRIKSSGLAGVVSHKRVIVPQLGAPGVAAHLVIKQTGFKVIYGPVEAVDIPAFIDAGLKATPEMRVKNFPLRQRLVLTPVEIVGGIPVAILIALVGIFLAGLGGSNDFAANIYAYGPFTSLAVLTGLLSGALFTPALLPWLPGRSFSIKGAVAGLLFGWILIIIIGVDAGSAGGYLYNIAWLLFICSASAFLAMNFTGASTYTSLSGVKKEMKTAVPAEIAGAGIGLILLLVSLFIL